RMALCMIEEAEKRGDLKPGSTIVDQSTGNTGPALSFVGNVKGYPVKIFLPAQLKSAYNSADRVRIARLYGAEVTPIDINEFVDGADQLQGVERAASFVAIRMKQAYDLQQNDPSNWWANQLCNVDNTKAHREFTGQEILEQIDGKIDVWVASVGTGGTLLGVAQTLKEANPELRIAGVVPTDDPRIEWVRSRAIHKALENFGVPKLRFLIEDVLENNVMDKEITVENADAKNMADRLCREEGLYCGMSSGANVVAAIEMAKSMDKGSKIVTVIVDRRDRYSAEYPNEHYVV
ncbi:MAG TPA: cysteine synthase family protein, partial [Rhodospirillales bacterium]|nr:cysteine synthase family protein [Rhodospirillales bacterium]